MATSSSWRTNGGNGAPRWSQAAASNNNSQNQSNATATTTTTAAATAASTPRSAGNMNVNRPNIDRDYNDFEAIQRDRMMYLLVGLVVSF